jgi:hypothetical protein
MRRSRVEEKRAAKYLKSLRSVDRNLVDLDRKEIKSGRRWLLQTL